MLWATEVFCEPVAVSAHNCKAVSQLSFAWVAVTHDERDETANAEPVVITEAVALIDVPAVLDTVGENEALPDGSVVTWAVPICVPDTPQLVAE
jgi:hypothetical protein